MSRHRPISTPTLDDSPEVDTYWNQIQQQPIMADLLKQQLREQVQIPDNRPLRSLSELTLAATAVAEEVLLADEVDKKALDEKLEQLFTLQRKTYLGANIPSSLRKRQFICSSGLIMSPDYCITTIRDSLRIRSFMRGVHQAVKARFRKHNYVHIVYPACGPFAPLLLPLISYYQQQGLYTANDIGVTLIDAQKGATLSLEALIDSLSLKDYIKDIICLDANQFRTDNPIDIVVLEAMQHGFSREGHLSLARHFASLLPDDGIMLPKEISISAVLNVGQREYVEQWQLDNQTIDSIQQEVRAERTLIGEILNINLSSLKCMEPRKIDEYSQLLECGTVTIPELSQNPDKQTLLIQTKITTWGNEFLDEYESGITHPLPDMQVCINFIPKDSRPGDLLVKSGDKLTFYYCLNGLPGFLATIGAEID